MKTSIFIKTYHKDLEWLSYCIKSIERFCSGFHGFTVVIDQDMSRPACVPVDWFVTSWPVYARCAGYIQQQVCKMESHRLVPQDTESILFVDSDCIFHSPCSPENFYSDGKPVLLKTRYSERLGDGNCWKSITERIIERPVDFEYMRRMPLLFLASTVRLANEHINDKLQKMVAGDITEFSEFNLIGAFAEFNQHSEYTWVDTEEQPEKIPAALCKQYWSWGGITLELHEEIQRVLR